MTKFAAAAKTIRALFSRSSDPAPDYSILSLALVDPNGTARVYLDSNGALVTPNGAFSDAQIVTTSTPTTGGTVTFGTAKSDELLNLTPAGTLATLTVTFPSNTNSRIGQRLSVVSTQIITALTVSSSGLTLRGIAATALAANVPISFIKVAASTWQRIDALGTASGLIIQSPVLNAPSVNTQALSGAGAVNVTTGTTKLTTTGSAQALTLADGTDGQIKTILHDVDGGSAVLTPTTKTGFSTITFTSVGESATLQFATTRGWFILALNGAVAA